MLAGRELSVAQLKRRLEGRGFDTAEIETVVERLREQGALDDTRVACAYARTASKIRHRGPDRIRREIEALGVDRAIAKQAVLEVLGEEDETAMIERAISRRLRGGTIRDSAGFRKLYQYLVRQGFTASKVMAALKKRSKMTFTPADQG